MFQGLSIDLGVPCVQKTILESDPY